MNVASLENLLKETIGLDATTIGSTAVERAVRERMRATDIKSGEDYEQAVRGSPEELKELVENIVVPETWFFRDIKAFTALEQMVRANWLPKNPAGTLRVLSVPCSTGEEPYSIAMCLRKLGLPRFQVDAVDISHRVLAAARRGIYGRNSFRSAELEFRHQHFEKTAEGYVLAEAVKGPVRFEQGNLLKEDFTKGRAKYDFIFCRNLLIYFDVPTREHAFRVLDGLLANDGALFVGPSESGVAVNHGFVSARLPLSFAFYKVGSPLAAVVAKPAVKKIFPAPDTSSFRKIIREAIPAPEKPTPAPAVNGKGIGGAESLEHARQLADAGKLEEAANICHAYLEKNGPTADAFYLLGLMQDASNRRDLARDFYRKALYLQPNHYETLVHLALLTQSLGDSAGALVLQARAERANQKAKA